MLPNDRLMCAAAALFTEYFAARENGQVAGRTRGGHRPGRVRTAIRVLGVWISVCALLAVGLNIIPPRLCLWP